LLILAFLPAFPRDKVPLSRRPGNRTIDGKAGGNMWQHGEPPPALYMPDLSIFSV